jgi:co-chaperonin GroES (HSP10)
MSEVGLILPPGSFVPPTMQKVDVENIPMEDRGKQLPEPRGFMVLCALVDTDSTFEGTEIIKADQTKKNEEVSSPVLFVLKLGPEAYTDASRFPSGPRCKEGDFIITRPYAGTRVKIHGREFRLINDDMVDATVQDPRGISRI